VKPPVRPDRLRQIFSDIFEVPVANIENTSSPDTIATWDSIRHLNLVVALEQEFQVQFDTEEIVQLLSFELAVDILTEKCSTNGSCR
jgi:acyl carrier protein